MFLKRTMASAIWHLTQVQIPVCHCSTVVSCVVVIHINPINLSKDKPRELMLIGQVAQLAACQNTAPPARRLSSPPKILAEPHDAGRSWLLQWRDGSTS